MMKLTRRHRRFLAVIYPTGTIARGSSTGFELYRAGLVEVSKFGRYGITAAGADAIKDLPEAKWFQRAAGIR